MSELESKRYNEYNLRLRRGKLKIKMEDYFIKNGDTMFQFGFPMQNGLIKLFCYWIWINCKIFTQLYKIFVKLHIIQKICPEMFEKDVEEIWLKDEYF